MGSQRHRVKGGAHTPRVARPQGAELHERHSGAGRKRAGLNDGFPVPERSTQEAGMASVWEVQLPKSGFLLKVPHSLNSCRKGNTGSIYGCKAYLPTASGL